MSALTQMTTSTQPIDLPEEVARLYAIFSWIHKTNSESFFTDFKTTLQKYVIIQKCIALSGTRWCYDHDDYMIKFGWIVAEMGIYF